MLGNKKEVISFRKVIPANTTQILAERVKGQGTVESVRIRFYPGQSRSLRVVPFILHKGEQAEDLITYAETSERYLSGDDDRLEFPCVAVVDNDDFVKVRATNINLNFDYTLVIDIIIDYYGGKNRVAGGMEL